MGAMAQISSAGEDTRAGPVLVVVKSRPGDDGDALEPRTGEGSPASLDAIIPLLYDELRALARSQLRREGNAHSLATTGLVHEAYVKLAASTGVGRRGRAYFFGAAARAMRQVLVEQARRRQAAKRGGGERPVTLDTRAQAPKRDDVSADILDLERALAELEASHPRLARVVECRFFGGLSVGETAEALGVSARTVKYDWALARARLYQTLEGTEAAE